MTKIYVVSCKYLQEVLMSLSIQKPKTQATIKSKFNDEFQHYLKKQCLKTTFNGLELETFSWYKKVLGLV